MRELPELQAHAERLDRDFAGASLDRFEVTSPTALRTTAPEPGVARRHPVAFVGRRGRYVLADFGVVTFVVDVPRGGGLHRLSERNDRSSLEAARWVFGDGRAWSLTELRSGRRAGVWVVAGDPETQEPLSDLGPDANELSSRRLLGQLHAEVRPLYDFLQDQRLVAGLGPRLAAEVSHRAKLSPFVSTVELDSAAADRVVEAIQACVNEALAHERGYDDLNASDEQSGNVYQRAGEACPVCGDTIAAAEHGSRTVSWCPTCQSGGRSSATTPRRSPHSD